MEHEHPHRTSRLSRLRSGTDGELPHGQPNVHARVGSIVVTPATATEFEPVVVAARFGALNLLETGNALTASAIPDLVRIAELRTTTHGIELIST